MAASSPSEIYRINARRWLRRAWSNLIYSSNQLIFRKICLTFLRAVKAAFFPGTHKHCNLKQLQSCKTESIRSRWRCSSLWKEQRRKSGVHSCATRQPLRFPSILPSSSLENSPIAQNPNFHSTMPALISCPSKCDPHTEGNYFKEIKKLNIK